MNKFSLIFLSTFMISGYIHPTITPEQKHKLEDLKTSLEAASTSLKKNRIAIDDQLNKDIHTIDRIICGILKTTTGEFRNHKTKMPAEAYQPIPKSKRCTANRLFDLSSIMVDIIPLLANELVPFSEEMEDRIDYATILVQKILQMSAPGS